MIVPAITAAVLLAAAVWTLRRFDAQRWTEPVPQFHDPFSSNGDGQLHQGGWEPFGGTWQVQNGTMQNLSDDRGARLMNGSARWRNYIVEADIELLGEAGDAGLLVRSSDEEVGVDSYHGYFVGLRDLDETFILGRADYGWHEYQTIPVHSGVHTRTWYHLKVLAYECNVIATVTGPNGEVSKAILFDPACLSSGRFGLQSYATGAAWRNLSVRPAAQSDLNEMLSLNAATAPEFHIVGQSPSELWTEQRFIAPMKRELTNHKADLNARPIGDLKLLPPNRPTQVTIHGVVTLVSPILFVQDSTGGIAIPGAHADPPVQIGDSVEASGEAELHDFSSVLRNAEVRLLWSHTPVPPVSVTVAQAATGSFDAQYIEIDGRLVEEQKKGERSIRLKLAEGSQLFEAIAESPSLAETLSSLKTGSRLRVRGICVTDRAYARDEIPFALLMRSVDDVNVIEPPPWWTLDHVIELAIGIIAFSFLMQAIYASVKRSQFRAVIEERERLALEMHDTLAQSFAGVGFQLEALCNEVPPENPMHLQLQSTVDMVRTGHQEARRNIAALRPGNLEQMGLAKALEHAAHVIVQGGPIAVSMSVRGEPREMPLRVGDALFRIGQEAVANAVRHGHPRNIQLSLVYGRPSVKLTIRDDGQGFSIQEETAGFGIRGMMRRAESINATFRIRSSLEHGASVQVRATLQQTQLSTWWYALMRNRNWKQGSREIER
jgi:signal transduction histidine kinase